MTHIKKKFFKQNKTPHQLYKGNIQGTLKEQSLETDPGKTLILSFLSWVSWTS